MHNAQVLSSSGFSDFDKLLGGGIPVSSLVTVHADAYSNYAQVAANLFVSEGMADKHAVVVASLSPDVSSMLYSEVESVPAPTPNSATNAPSAAAAAAPSMQIAWQYEKYQKLPSVASSSSTSSSSTSSSSSSASSSSGRISLARAFDISRVAASPAALPTVIDLQQHPTLSSLVSALQSLILSLDESQLVRVLLCPPYPLSFLSSLTRNAIKALRATCRTANVSIMWLVPSEAQLKTLASPAIVSAVHSQSDLVLEYASFAGADMAVSEWEEHEYSGVFRVKKCLHVNALPNVPAQEDRLMGFKMRPRGMHLLRLQQAPEVSRDRPTESTPSF
jgi:hypothetical protein